MRTEKKPTHEQVLKYLNQVFDNLSQEFDIADKDEAARQFIFEFKIEMDNEWISKLERILERKFTELEKFKIDVLCRIYFFHSDGAGADSSYADLFVYGE